MLKTTIYSTALPLSLNIIRNDFKISAWRTHAIDIDIDFRIISFLNVVRNVIRREVDENISDGCWIQRL